MPQPGSLSRVQVVAIIAGCVLVATPAAGQRAAPVLRETLVAWAEATWGPCARGRPRLTRIEEVMRVGAHQRLVMFQTGCHHDEDPSGLAYSPVLVGPTGVRAAPFAADPEWTSARLESLRPGLEMLSNAWLSRQDGSILLFVGYLHRSIGLPAAYFVFRWDGERFVRFEERFHDGGMLWVEDPGPFPIVAPLERTCLVELEVIDVAARRARLTTVTRGERRHFDLPLQDDDCARGSQPTDTIECGGQVSYDPSLAYIAVARGGDWVVVRVTPEDARGRIVLRVPRSCSLAGGPPPPR